MAKRISHSLLDPWLSPLVHKLYPLLPIPRRFPPEGIIALGHVSAIVGASGFAWSTQAWWAGLIAALGVAGNHLADMFDGTHARATGQCRNGGELLDHFTDPLSFSYWLVGLAVSCGRLDLGLAGVICLFATAVLTNIKAKLIGEFTLSSFGPTEFKALLIGYGVAMSALAGGIVVGVAPATAALWFLATLIVVGIVQLAVQLVRSVREVNEHGGKPDASEWVTVRSSDAGSKGQGIVPDRNSMRMSEVAERGCL
jgi:phosphatidylglycerophosphate synthase